MKCLRIMLAKAREVIGRARYAWWARRNVPREIDPRYEGRRASRRTR